MTFRVIRSVTVWTSSMTTSVSVGLDSTRLTTNITAKVRASPCSIGLSRYTEANCCISVHQQQEVMFLV